MPQSAHPSQQCEPRLPRTGKTDIVIEKDDLREGNAMQSIQPMGVVVLASCLVLGGLHASAQTAQTAPTTQASSATDWKTQHDKQLLEDFAWLARFRDMDAALPEPAADETRVVFMGDSITENWQHDGIPMVPTFPGHPWVEINRGISGQTTPQMLIRFRQDVIDLKPTVVVLMAGTNDIAGNTGVMTLGDTENNLASMADLARVHHIRMVLCSVPPTADFPWHKGLLPAQTIRSLNAWIAGYADDHGLVYVNFWKALATPDGGMQPSLSLDGVHPNHAGYAIMNPLVDAGIRAALAQPAP